MTKLLQFLALSGVIVLLGGSLFLLDGAWRTYRQYVESTKWPSVEARVAGCSIGGSWHAAGSPSSRNIQGESSYVRCTLDYQTGGLVRENTINVGSRIFTSPSGKYPVSRVTVAAMHDWIARHPAGSTLTVHYDPSDPNNVSMAGADSELRTDSPKDRFQLGILGTVGGLALLVLSRMARKPSAATNAGGFSSLQ
jgi:Protein of unknown function (DUF3592)